MRQELVESAIGCLV